MPPDAASRATPVRYAWIGIALLATATLCYSTHTNLARLSYDHGVDTLTILSTRSVVAVLLLAPWFAWRGLSPWLPRRAWPMMLLAGGTFALQSLFYLQAIHFIPVSLAVLLFYLFPILVIFLAWALGHERLTGVRIAGAAIAFFGLSLTLGVTGRGLNWLGIGLGAAAALTLAVNVVVSSRMVREHSAIAVTFNMLLVAGIAYIVAVILIGGPSWPQGGAPSWAIFLGAVVAAPLAQLCFYSALAFTGGSRASIIMYGEPITTAGLAMLLLGETLSAVQLVGAALVVGAIFGVALLDRRRR